MMKPHPIPLTALEMHIAILGKAGSGKTVTAKGLMEGILDRGERACAVDPTGVYWGMRLKPDGKTPSKYQVVIFGGLHADVQISGDHGAPIAEIVGTSSTPAIIDVSQMTVGERTRFFTDFANTLLRKNRGPLHLFIDEAHLFAPQGRVADPQSGMMLHAANNLVSLGRSRGLRITMISQRPAKLHKDSLTQIETLVAMRLIAPQDRRAIEDWIEDQADEKEGRKIIAALPSLKKGEAFMWAPELEILERVSFPMIKTFDSSRAPTVEDDDVQLKPINVVAVNELLEKIGKDIIESDPRRLKQEVVRLRQQLEKSGGVTKSDWILERQRVEEASQSGQVEGYRNAMRLVGVKLDPLLAEIKKNMVASVGASEEIRKSISSLARSMPKSNVMEHATTISPALALTPTPSMRAIQSAYDLPAGGLTGPETKILRSLEFWRTMGDDNPNRAQVAFIANYSPRSSGYEKALSTMKGKGLISHGSGRVRVVAMGRVGAPNKSEAMAMFQDVLTRPALKVVLTLNDSDEPLSRYDLARESDYSDRSSGYEKTLSVLHSTNVIVFPERGKVTLSPWSRELLRTSA